MNFEKLLELIYSSLPYPEQVKDWDLTSDSEALRFTWRDTRFRVTKALFIEEVKEHFLYGTDLCILLQKLLKDNASIKNYYR